MPRLESESDLIGVKVYSTERAPASERIFGGCGRRRAAVGKGVKGIHRLRDPERARAVGLFCQLGLEIQSKLPHD